jgi:hypothetical protein
VIEKERDFFFFFFNFGVKEIKIRESLETKV